MKDDTVPKGTIASKRPAPQRSSGKKETRVGDKKSTPPEESKKKKGGEDARCMKKSGKKPASLIELRKAAEERLGIKTQKKDPAKLSDQELQQYLIQELDVNQAELEAQNEELRCAQRELDASQRSYADLYNLSPVGYFTFDKDGVIEEMNLTGAGMLGYGERFLRGKPFSVVIPERQGRELFISHLKDTIRKGMRQSCEIFLRRKNKTVFPALVESIPAEDEKGVISLCRTVVTDITERRRKEEELRESEERYRSLVELSPDPIVVHRGGKFVYLNPAALNLLGAASPSDILGEKVLGFIHPDDQAAIRERIRHIEGKGTPTPLRETKMVRLDGQTVIVESAASPGVYDGLPAIQVMMRDITARKKAEEELAKSKLEFEAIYNSISDAAIFSDTGRWIVMINPATERMFGYPLDEIRGKLTEIFYADKKDFVRLREERSAAGSAASGEKPYEMHYRRKDGREFIAETVCNPVADSRGDTIGFIAILRDITERKSAEEELKRHRDHLADLVEARTADLVRTNVELEKEIVDRLRIEKRINATNELLENMFSNVHVMIAYMDRNFNFIRVNRTYAAADDRNPEFFVGKNHFDLYPNEENEAIFRNVVETGTPFSTYGKPFVYAGYPERGTTYWDWSLQPVRDTEGEVMGLVLSLVNVTDQYLALEALRKSEGHFRALIENALDIVVILNTEGRIRYSSPSLETTLGYRQEDLLGRDVFELVHPDDVPSMVLLFGQVLAHPEGRRATSVRIRHKDGSWRILEGKGKRLETEPGSIVVNAWDITLLKATEQHLRDLAEHLITVREEERGRIAREVHDELGQLLTALKMDLAWVDKKVPSHNEALRERTRSMLELINEITKAVRKISSELRPALLDNLGLIPALEWQCREFQERTGITCDAHLAVKDVAMEAERATHIFRMFQEALTNVARHSEATKVKISVNSSPDGVLELEIEDNGKGIEEKNFLNPRSFGLIGMQERVAYLGGNMEIKGIAGEGTTISIIVPFVSDRIR